MSVAGWSQEKRERSYLFIDGGYLRGLCRDLFSNVFQNDAMRLDFGAVSSSFLCSKFFYYDCVNERRSNEGEDAFEVRKRAQSEEFETIRELPGYHVIEGTLSGRRQKEVDVSLAVDMLTHAFNRNMGWAHLIAGDLDFRPLVQALVRMGVYVTIWSRRKSVAMPLRWAADDAKEISSEFLYGWCAPESRGAYRLPHRSGGKGSADGCTTLKRGTYLDGSVVIYHRPNNLYFLQRVGKSEATSFWLDHQDPNILERFFKLEHGDVMWE